VPRSRATALPPDQRRESIIDAVVPLLAERGAAVTTAEIAEAAGVAEGTIFTVFDDKASVIRAAFVEVLDPAPSLKSIEGIDPTLPLEGQVLAAVRILIGRGADVVGVAAALRALPPPKEHDTGIVEAARDAAGRIQLALAGLLEAHAPQLRLEPADVATAIQALVWHSSHAMAANPIDAESITDIALHGSLRPEVHPC
jgi:AcrR family transcriptional regulator